MIARLERQQAWVYLVAILLGLLLGTAVPGAAAPLQTLVWPTLGVLLFATFTQVPLDRLPEAARDRRFLLTVMAGNFLVLPVVVWALLPLAGDAPAVRVGVLLVLLVPCTDWFLTFTHLAGGDTRRAITVTPLNLLLQLLLLPGYVWLLLGQRVHELVGVGRAATVFATLIALPLAAAWAVQRLGRRRTGRAVPERLGALPVPLLALVVFLISASQVPVVVDAVGLLPRLLAIYLAFLAAAALIGLALTRLAGLGPRAGRALVFSLGTRNSFVVLPLALALPAGLETAVVVVVFQSLVELFGMVGFLRLVPRLLPVDAR